MNTDSDDQPSAVESIHLTVDGESWEVAAIGGQLECRWLRANDPDYGFTSRPFPADFVPSLGQVEEMIREFMGNVNPETGYLD